MKGLVVFMMNGRMQAVVIAAVLAVLASEIPPLGIVSAAAIGLVALRHGEREAAIVGVMGLALVGLLGLILTGQPEALVVMVALLWAPLLLLGGVLRLTRSLALSVETAIVLGVLAVAGQYLLIADVQQFWGGFLDSLFEQAMDPAHLPEVDRKAMVADLAPWMPGALASAWFMQLCLSLFLARYWQALLYKPSGFRAEFHELRLGRWLLIAVPLVLLATRAMGDDAGFISQLSLLGISAFLLQGISLVHGMVGKLNAGVNWLIGFYLLMVIGMPYSITAISAAGYADGWLNFRAKARARSDKDEEG